MSTRSQAPRYPRREETLVHQHRHLIQVYQKKARLKLQIYQSAREHIQHGGLNLTTVQ